MNHTTNYNLNKPETTDFYNVDDFNDNMDILDTAVSGIASTVAGKQDALNSADVTLTAAGWDGSANTVTVTGMSATALVWVGIGSTATSTQVDAAGKAKLVGTGQATSALTITAYGTVPSVDIPLTIMWA